MGTLLGVSGLMLDLVGSAGFAMSLYVFWEAAIQKDWRWAYALVGPLLGVLGGWGGAALLGAVARAISADWKVLLAIVRLIAEGLTVCGWLSLLAIPMAWAACAVRCWPVVRQGVWGWGLSVGALTGGSLAIHAAMELLRA